MSPRHGRQQLPIKHVTGRRWSFSLQKSSSMIRDPKTAKPGPGLAADPRQADSRRRHLLFLFLLFFIAAGNSSFSDSLVFSGMQCARCPILLALMASVLCSPASSSQQGRDQIPNLDKNLDLDQDQDLQMELELQQHRLLQQARSAGLLSEVRVQQPSANQ